jgi:DNA-binding XRE family transcriptional regulator
MLHPHTRFYIEMDALSKWTFKLYNVNADLRKRTIQRFRSLKDFTNEFMTSYLWEHFDHNNIPRATKREKVVYLTEMGCSRREIEERLHVSPNTITQIQKEMPNLRYMKPNIELDYLIEFWNKHKHIIPKEILKNC